MAIRADLLRKHPELKPCKIGEVLASFRHLYPTKLTQADALRIISQVDRAFAQAAGLPEPAEYSATAPLNTETLIPQLYSDAYNFALLRANAKREEKPDAVRYYTERYQWEKKCAVNTWKAAQEPKKRKEEEHDDAEDGTEGPAQMELGD